MPVWIGPKTKEWESIRRILKVRFEGAGITWCEFRYDGCWRDNGLTFAHKDKRRHLTHDELYETALACISCHMKLEAMNRFVMRDKVLAVIAKRTCKGLDKPYLTTD